MADIHGLDLGELPEHWRALNCIAIFECIDLTDTSENVPGAKRLSTRCTDDLDVWTAIGMLRAAAADLEHQYLDALEE